MPNKVHRFLPGLREYNLWWSQWHRGVVLRGRVTQDVRIGGKNERPGRYGREVPERLGDPLAVPHRVAEGAGVLLHDVRSQISNIDECFRGTKPADRVVGCRREGLLANLPHLRAGSEHPEAEAAMLQALDSWRGGTSDGV